MNKLSYFISIGSMFGVAFAIPICSLISYLNNPSNNGKGLLLGCVAGIPIGMIGGLIVYLLINAKKDKKNWYYNSGGMKNGRYKRII